MKLYLICISFLLTLLSFTCNKEDLNTACPIDNAITELPWLAEKKRVFDLDMSAVIQSIIAYEWRGQTYFMINVCDGCADAMTQLYDCSGNLVCKFGGIAGRNTCPDFEKEAKEIKVLYRQ